MARCWSSTALLCALFHLYTALIVLAADGPFDCHPTVGSVNYDLSALKGEHTLSRTRETPPSTIEDVVVFDLCGELPKKSDVPDADQCPSGTQVCLTQVNKKPNLDDRVISVIPVVQVAALNPEISALSSPAKGLSIILHGAEYPHATNSTPTAQSLQLTLLCEPGSTSEPKFVSYDGAQLKVEWSAQAGCAVKDDDHEGDGKSPDGDDKKDEGNNESSMGSGIGWFFLVLLLAFLAYFVVGAYYNYSTYGASGADLIPLMVAPLVQVKGAIWKGYHDEAEAHRRYNAAKDAGLRSDNAKPRICANAITQSDAA
ncbi:hypothetical protein ONZ45_g13864 [Pleurotus djamor]|nr:hypothetical protein ONZ45_g13864 [Pleurotus djamor]